MATLTLRAAVYLGLFLVSLAVLADARRGGACIGKVQMTTTYDAPSENVAPASVDLATSGTYMDSGVADQEAMLAPSKTSGRLPDDRSNVGGSSMRKRTPTDLRPTPEPTGASSPGTTVHINDEHDFAMLLPDQPGELISDAESDGVAYCTTGSTDSSCTRRVQDGFIRAAAVSRSDDGKWIQITGCLDTSKSTLDPSDGGGQFDVRFPDGAQCTFGGYGASFIQLVEPAASRFCLRCCNSADDQTNCNSHQDRDGCQTVIPGTYSFPEAGVSCED